MVDPCGPWCLIIFLDYSSPGMGMWDFFSYLIYPVVVLMRHLGVMGVYPCHLHRWWVFLPLHRAVLIFLVAFELEELVVVVDFLSVYPVALCFWAGILVCHPARFFIFVLISISRFVWWWLTCDPVSGSSHGTLCVGSHRSRILSFPIVGKHFWNGFKPCVLRNCLAL